jgi:hypothetical protein
MCTKVGRQPAQLFWIDWGMNDSFQRFNGSLDARRAIKSLCYWLPGFLYWCLLRVLPFVASMLCPLIFKIREILMTSS